MEKIPTTDVIKIFNCHRITALNWAKKNNVQKIGTIYFWSEEDMARFQERPKPGGYRRKEKSI